MTAKEYLRQLKRLETIINQKVKEQGDLRAISAGISSFDYTKERVRASGSKDAPYERTIGRIMELDEEINREIERYTGEKHKIISQIHELQDEKNIEILYKRYVEFKRLENIAVEMNYTYQYVVELHGYALLEFQRKFEKMLKNL